MPNVPAPPLRAAPPPARAATGLRAGSGAVVRETSPPQRRSVTMLQFLPMMLFTLPAATIIGFGVVTAAGLLALVLRRRDT